MLTGAQIRMARGYLRWSVKDLAQVSGVAESTIKRMELQEGFPDSKGANIQAVHRALVDAGIVFIDGNGHGPGVALKKDPLDATGPSKASRAKRPRDNGDDFGAVAFASS